MDWFARVGGFWGGRRVRVGFMDSDPCLDGRWRDSDGSDPDTVPEFMASPLDIDLTEPEPPPAVDFFSSSFDLMHGLTVSEVPLDRIPAELRHAFRR